MKREKPNILWICTDSQRWDTLGCYGNKWVKTPNIDRLASEGMLFENVFCQNPLCTPSRGNFLTGRYPVTNKLRQNGQDIPPDEILVTKVLRDNGYVCGLSGKLHICACDHRIKLYGRDPDNWWRYSDELHFKGVEPRIDDGYDEFHWDHAPSEKFRSSSYIRWLREKGKKIEYTERSESRHVSDGLPDELHQTTFCVEKAMDFIRAYETAPYPWLFSVNIFAPHFRLIPPKEYLDRYLGIIDEIPDACFEDDELDNKPYFQKKFQSQIGMKVKEMTPYERKFIKAAYWAMVDHIDYQVGRLLDILEETGQKNETMVIFTSDHGELLGDHGLYVKGPFLYDAAVRVPLIISYPNVVPAGIRRKSIAELGDLAPTVLDCAGLPRQPGMQAKSLWQFITDEIAEDNFRDSAYCEYYNSNPDTPAQFCTMVRDQKHKIIVYHGQELGELYDLENDPGELKNLWNCPQYMELKMNMLKKTCDRMAETADPLPDRIGIY